MSATARIIGGQSVLDAEARDQRRIAARRARDEARRIKFLTAKTRLIGVDKAAIEAQLREKEARRAAAKAADAAHAHEQRMIRDLVEENITKEREEEYAEKRMYAERQLQSKDRSLRREWDLNDPQALAKERKTTADSLEATGGAGPSSMLVFGGEDRNYGDRKRIMQAQFRDWTNQQIERNAERQRALQESDRIEAETVRQIVEATGAIEAKEAAEKYEEALMYAEANQQLAMDSQHRRARARAEENAANREHVDRQRNSAFLSEDPRAGLLEGGVRRDQWKGMNVSQLQSHYDAQYEQILEKQRAKQSQAMEDAKFAETQRQILDAMQQVTLKEQMEHTQLQMDYRLTQAEQAVQAKERKNREVHTGAVTDEFFKYFGTSAR